MHITFFAEIANFALKEAKLIYSRIPDEDIAKIEKGSNVIEKVFMDVIIKFDNYATVISDILDCHYLDYNIDFDFGDSYLVININGSLLPYKNYAPYTFIVKKEDKGKLTLSRKFLGEYRKSKDLELNEMGFAISHYVLGNNCKYCTVDVYPEFI